MNTKISCNSLQWDSPALPPPAFQTGTAETTAGSAAEEPDIVAGMDKDPTGIKDLVIMKLRAALKMSKISVDDLLAEATEQVDMIEQV